MAEFWAEEKANLVERRHNAPYVISDWKTPSGHIHVGSLRGVLLHEAVARTLRNRGREVRYIFGFDDFDPFDKVPVYLDQTYEKFLGKPMSTVPLPDQAGCPTKEISPTQNYGRLYADEFEQVYRNLGVESETLYTSNIYRDGQFNQSVELALDNAAEIKAAYEAAVTERTEGRSPVPFDNYPLNVVCESCGRIDQTTVKTWDGKVVTYSCQFCSNSGETSPFDGRAKLPWKVEWAAKFFIFKTDLEGAGKDHYTKGGSRDVANEIFRRVYLSQLDSEYAHLPVDLFYEHLYLEGKKMSTSKGVGATAVDMAELLPAHLLRFLLVEKRPKTAISFNSESPDQIFRLYDRFDQVLTSAVKNPNGNDSITIRLAQIENIAELPEYTMRFATIIYLLQLPNQNILETAQKECGRNLSQAEKNELEERITAAKKWLKTAPAEYRIELQETLPEIRLSDSQREFLSRLAPVLADSAWEGQVLHELIHQVRKDQDIDPKEAFKSLYQIFLGRDSGPQAGWFLASLDRKFVIDRLEKSSQ